MKGPLKLYGALIIVFLFADLGMAQFKLPVDAEYEGALLDSTQNIALYNSGHLRAAHLKADYVKNGITFEAGSIITFEANGTVLSGTIKDEVAIGKMIFIRGLTTFYADGSIRTGRVKAGSIDANLIIPVDSEVTLDSFGKVANVSSGVKHRLLGMTVRGITALLFNRIENTYSLSIGNVGEAQLIAFLPTQRTEVTIITAIPVVVPSGAQFDYRSASSGRDGDIWIYPGNFQINNYNFGVTPQLHIKDFKLVGITIQQPLVIGNHQFQAGQKVRLDDVGKVLPPFP